MISNSKNSLSRRISTMAVAVSVIALAEFLLLNLMFGVESSLNDRFVQSQAAKLVPDQDIVIIDIDEYSLFGIARKEGYGRYPWPRELHGQILTNILKQKPKAIIYDILFSDQDNEAESNSETKTDSDDAFANIIRQTNNVYFPILRLPAENDSLSELELSKFGSALGFTATENADPTARIALQLPGIAAAIDTGRLGNVEYIEEADGIGRRYLLYTEAYGWRIPSLPTRLARDLGYPISNKKSMLLHWRGGKHAFQRVAFYDLYDDFFNRQSPLRANDEFRDKIVIIGATAPALGDQRSTPIDSLYPGVEILATAISNLKNNRTMREPHPAIPDIFPATISNAIAKGIFPSIITLAIIFSLLYAFNHIRNSFKIFTGYLIFSAIVLLISYLAIGALIVIPIFRPLLFGWLYYTLAALYEYLDEKRTRERSMQMFSRFVDPRVVNDLVSEGEEGLNKYFNAQRIQCTVLFSDIRGFTTMSQHREPEEIVNLLNQYFSRQTDVIFHHGGTMDKFIGDAIMAFWGAPIADPNHAQHAVDAALDMVEALQLFKISLGGELGDSFDIGIGIHSGEAVVGMIGSETKLDYTCIGDTVNTASRLEGQTKGRARILVSDATKALCNDNITFVDHGAVSVKGRDESVKIFEPQRTV